LRAIKYRASLLVVLPLKSQKMAGLKESEPPTPALDEIVPIMLGSLSGECILICSAKIPLDEESAPTFR
jgi:hypothetical protein